MRHFKFILTSSAIATGLACGQAFAQPLFGDKSDMEEEMWSHEGSYLSITGFVVEPEDQAISSTDPGLAGIIGAFDSNMTFDTSAGIGLALGYQYDWGLRGEVEYAYRSIEFDKLSTTVDEFGVEGNGNQQSLMANVYYDIPITLEFKPYIGAGVGIAQYEARMPEVDGTSTGLSRGSDAALAYQVMAGLGYSVTPKTTLFAGARWMNMEEADFGEMSGELETINIEFGLRFGF